MEKTAPHPPQQKVTFFRFWRIALVATAPLAVLCEFLLYSSFTVKDDPVDYGAMFLFLGVCGGISLVDAGMMWLLLRFPERVTVKRRVLFVAVTALLLTSPGVILSIADGKFGCAYVCYFLMAVLYMAHIPLFSLCLQEKRFSSIPKR